MFKINFADDWSRTADLCYCKQPLYQLIHNHCRELLVDTLLFNCFLPHHQNKMLLVSIKRRIFYPSGSSRFRLDNQRPI